ncbi:MAG: hypothetical protein QME74_06200, partial [Candidatus Edwardsbacteria bacterium]|nr:hypothetical protein [Candidatus Edwardsbacteria bacterium]
MVTINFPMMPIVIRRASAHPVRRAAAVLFLLAATGAAALAQESGGLDSLAVDYLVGDQRNPALMTQPQPEPDLGLMLERQLIADQPLALNYYTLGGFWSRNRERGLAELWRQGNAAFLAKPAAQRTGEGLIPDIQVPLPVLGSGAEIKLNGLQRFTVGGQQTVYDNNKSAYALGQQGSNFDLKIKQDTKVNLEGVIGERVHVLIDYDSQIETEKKSKVRLRYEGKEDEVLQKLEAGDTEFSIGGSSLAGGLTTVHKGLFGVKAEAKLAGLELTAIASKDEGQSQSNSYTGESRRDSVVIEDINYMKRRFFKLPLSPDDSLLDVRVVVSQQSSGQLTNTFFVNGIDRSWKDFAGIDTQSIDYGIRVEEKQSPEFFTYNEPHEPPRPAYLYLRQELADADRLGVAYRVLNRNTGIPRWVPDSSITIPDTSNPKYVLLLKPANCRPPDTLRPGRTSLSGYAWNYELRNFYDLRSRQIIPASLRVKLQKRTGGNDFLESDSARQKSYLNLIGLDADENGIIDFNWVKLGEDGYFFTPDSQPFWHVMPDSNPDLYRLNTLESSHSKYRFLAGFLSSEVSYRFLASAGRIIEGSVKVYLNNELVPVSNYRVDYDIGEIEFTNEDTKQRIKQPNAQLRIDYQYLPVFALGSKTLAGVRGVYKFSDKAALGGTWLYRSEQTPEERPRLGEEPRRIIVAGLDGSVEASSEFLTRAADALPLVETEVPSSVKLAGEFAANFPNPNTKGQVYVDDMDGAKQSDGLILDRRYWVHSSAPGKPDSLYAARCYWYNPTVKPTMGDINTEITDERTRKETVSTMILHVEPAGGDTGSWAGITNVISRSGMDFTERKILNLWVKGNAGRLHIDLGKEICEDQVRRRRDRLIPGNNEYDSEPLAPDGTQTPRNDTDVGIDGVAGDDGKWSPDSSDDGNDDFNGDELAKINGTEKNGQFDTEDLLLTGKGPGTLLAPKNNYYTFNFDLAAPGANSKGWHKYSVPLENAGIVGAPYNWNDIFYGRIWVDGLAQAADVELALVEVSGNQWIEQSIARRDTNSAAIDTSEKFAIGVRNNRDDAGYSANPPYDPGKDENGNLKFEQSLAFKVYNLRLGHAAVGRKSLRTTENNYTGYHRLRLYVKGESSQDTFFVRLTAADSNVYYQYLAPTSGGWQDVSIELDRLSSLKKPPYNGFRQDGAYSVRGSPNLTNISRIQLGVISGRSQPYTGEVWFDDLRLDDVRRDRGTAYWSTVDLKMADLLCLSAGYRHRGAHYYTMGEGRGSGVKSVNYNLSGALTLSKFYLDRLGFNLPLSFSQSVSEGFSEFGSDDIRSTEDESRAQRSWNRSRSGSFSLTRTKPTGWWLADATVNRMSYRGDWQQNAGFTRTSADSSGSFSQSVAYGWSPAQNRGFSVFKLTKLYYLPSSLSSSWNSSQTRQWHYEKSSGVQS